MAENQQKQNATQGQNQKPAPKSEFQDIPEAVSSQRINMGIVSPMAPSGAEITRQKRESGDGEFGRIIGKTKEGAQALNEKTPVQNKPTATESTPTPDVFRAAPRKMPEMSFHQDIDQKKKEEVISEKQKQVKTESDQIEKEPIAEEGAVEIDKEGEESKSFLEMIGLAQDEKEGEDAGKTDEGAEDEDMTGVSRMGNGEENDRKNTKFDESNLMATGNKSQWLTMKEKIVVRDEKPSDEERQGITVEKPMFSESEQAHAEAQGLSGLIRKIQKKWNKHILENAAKTGVINIEPGEKMKGLSPEQQLKQAAQASAERDAEIRRLREAQKIYEKGLATIKDLIAPSSMVIEYDHLQISGKYAQSFSYTLIHAIWR